MGATRTVAKNTFLLTFGVLSGRALSALLIRFMTPELGQEGIGIWGSATDLSAILLVITNWGLGTVVEAENLLQAVTVFEERVTASTRDLIVTGLLPVGLGIFVVVIGVGLFLTNRLVQPIQRLSAAAQAMGVGRWDTALPPAGDDEIGLLTQTFGTMMAQVRESVASLEARVAERTRDLERRTDYLEVSAEVGRAASSILDPERLIEQVVDLIPF